MAKVRARLPGLNVQRSDPQFDGARLANARGYGMGANIAGTTLLMYFGFALFDDESPITRAALTAGAAVTLPDSL